MLVKFDDREKFLIDLFHEGSFHANAEEIEGMNITIKQVVNIEENPINKLAVNFFEYNDGINIEPCFHLKYLAFVILDISYDSSVVSTPHSHACWCAGDNLTEFTQNMHSERIYSSNTVVFDTISIEAFKIIEKGVINERENVGHLEQFALDLVNYRQIMDEDCLTYYKNKYGKFIPAKILNEM